MLDQHVAPLASPAARDRDERSMKVFEYALAVVAMAAAVLLALAR
jgi:hypothetical protein